MSDLTLFITIMGFAIIVAGIIIAAINVYLSMKNNSTRFWHKTQCEIINSEIEKNQSLTKRSFDDHFKASINYEYTIDDDIYYSSRIFFGDSIFSPNKTTAKNLIKKYSLGDRINISYNPKNKKESVIEVGIRLNQIFNIFLAILLIAAGIYAVLHKALLVKLILDFA